MNRTTNEANARAQTRRNTVTRHESGADGNTAPAESEMGAANRESRGDFAELLAKFMVQRPYSLSEDGHTELRKLRGAISVLSTLSAEGQTCDGLIEFEADALYNLLSMLEDSVNDVLADAENGPVLFEEIKTKAMS